MASGSWYVAFGVIAGLTVVIGWVGFAAGRKGTISEGSLVPATP